MALSDNKLRMLAERVYNNTMITDEINNINDEKDIREYASLVFGDGSTNPDPSKIHQFNNLVVQQAEEVAKPKLAALLSLFANFKPARRGDIVKIELPASEMKSRVVWSANGSGVDLVRIAPNKTFELAQPRPFATGFYYEPLDMALDAVTYFRKAVDGVAEAKVTLYYRELSKIMATAIGSGLIPANNVASGSGLSLAQYNKIAGTLQRYGGRPVFVADQLMIDYFAKQQTTDTYYSNLLSDTFKDTLREEMVPTRIGKTDAVNLYNPFTDRTNNKVDLPINVGYMFASQGSTKPFSIVEFGGMRQTSEQDPEDERIKIKIVQEADIRLVAGWLFGYIKEDGSDIQL